MSNITEDGPGIVPVNYYCHWSVDLLDIEDIEEYQISIINSYAEQSSIKFEFNKDVSYCNF